MSLNKSATRNRLGLLAGSSLIAAGLSALAFTGAAVAPTAAIAQVTCTSPAAPTGNGTTAVTIAAGTYNPGITCAYVGTGSTVTTGGAVTVSSTAGGDGINLSATGSGAVNWVSSAGTVTAGAQTNGPLIDATSQTGAINLTVAGLTATAAGTTNAIRATTAGGAITIVNTSGQVNNNVAGGLATIDANAGGGNISITTGTGTMSGRLRGILARTSGAGSVTLNLGGTVQVNNIDGVAAADITAGSGGLVINITGGTLAGNQGGAGSTTAPGMAIIGASAGSATINVTAGTIGRTSFNLPTAGGGIDLSGVTGGGATLTFAGANSGSGIWLATGASTLTGANDVLNMNGVGANVLNAGASINFGAGNDTFNMRALLDIGRFDSASLDFGSGTDTFNMSGVMAVDGTTITGLEAFNNSGVIYLGAGGTHAQNPQVDFTATDGVAEDFLAMHGTTFTGSGDSRIVADVLLGAGEQAGCGTITVADCLDLSGGTTAGSTLITANFVGADADLGAYNPVGATVVDVNGGTSAAGHFVLDPNSTGYVVDPTFGGVIDRPGLFRYALRYDPANQRHNLVGLPRTETMEYAMLPSAARSVWYMTSKTVTDRQGDMRAGTDGTVWMRATGEYSKRDVDTGFENFGDTFTFDNSYKLYAGTVIGGMDLVSGTSGGYDYVVGAQLGYVGSSFDLNASDSSGRFTGATGGVYGSFWNSRFFFDGAFNTDFLTLDYDSPGLGSKTNTWLRSVGARGEAGMRYGLGQRMYVEPLATAAFVYTTFEEISLAGGEVRPDDAQSRRAALGLRIGADYPGQSVNWSYFVTGRLWNEFAGDSRVVVKNPGADLIYADDFSGTFSEFEAGLSLANDAGTVSGFLTTGVKAQDGYSAVDLATGVRLRW